MESFMMQNIILLYYLHYYNGSHLFLLLGRQLGMQADALTKVNVVRLQSLILKCNTMQQMFFAVQLQRWLLHTRLYFFQDIWFTHNYAICRLSFCDLCSGKKMRVSLMTKSSLSQTKRGSEIKGRVSNQGIQTHVI
jgi:hypothetical protein